MLLKQLKLTIVSSNDDKKKGQLRIKKSQQFKQKKW